MEAFNGDCGSRSRCLIVWSELEAPSLKSLGESYGSNEPVCAPICLDQQLRGVRARGEPVAQGFRPGRGRGWLSTW